jgi:hypothetical protein
VQKALGPRRAAHRVLRSAAGGDPRRALARFIDALAPLRAAGKLGAVHFQFAPWLLRNARASRTWSTASKRWRGTSSPRNSATAPGSTASTWSSTIEWERRLGLVHTVVDSPQGSPTACPASGTSTHPQLALVRPARPQQETWNKKGLAASSARFDYRYSADVTGSDGAGDPPPGDARGRVHVVFNTNNEDQGQANARLLRDVLRVNDR